ncbi:MAG: polysaccharide deacetylase family protein [Desulfovibrionaceae bacterium]|nr:polysaccharide deacetylase family protein [Desulfovibrionaceae bacterium]
MDHIWRSLFLAVLCLALLLTCREAMARVVDGDWIMDQPMSENLCALTFDDGPSRHTPQLLDMLGQYGIPATFFVLGRQVEYHPQTLRRMVAEGHEIGNHSYSHPNLRLIPQDQKVEEIHRTDAILRELGATPLFLRPPYGAYDNYPVDVAASLGMDVVLWSLDSRDWRSLPADYASLHHTRGSAYAPGHLRGVFLFHDTHKRTVDDLPRIIAQLRAGGCQRFVTMSQYLDGLQDLEPGMLMTRHEPRPAEQPLSPQPAPDMATGMAAGMAGCWPAGSGPVPLARSSRPWRPAHPPSLFRSGQEQKY